MKKSVALVCVLYIITLAGCSKAQAGQDEIYNNDIFYGFCVMPMEIREPEFEPKYTYDEAGYFRPHPDANKQVIHNTKWPTHVSVSIGSKKFGDEDYAYEYEIIINPRLTGDTYFSLQKLYSNANGVLYAEQIGSVFCLPLGCSSNAHGSFRINTGNSLLSEHFYFTVRYKYE